MQHYPSAFSNLLIRDIKVKSDSALLAVTPMMYRIKFLLVSLIRPDTNEFEELDLTVNEFIEYFELKSWGGNQYCALSDAISMLKSFRYTVGDEEIVWLTEDSNADGQNIHLSLHESLAPFLLNLKRNFSKIYYENIKNMKSKYSLRLYELLASMKGIGELQLKLKAAYETICDNNYISKSEFVTHVIDPAVEEINDCTDLNVTYRFEKSFGVPEKIIFKIGNATKSKGYKSPSTPPALKPATLVSSVRVVDENYEIVDLYESDHEIEETDVLDDLPF